MQGVLKVRLVSSRLVGQERTTDRRDPERAAPATSADSRAASALLEPEIAEDWPSDDREIDAPVVRTLRAAPAKAPCSQCKMRALCLPLELTGAELDLVDKRMVAGIRKVARGATLFRAGDPFDALFPVWTGVFKTVVASDQGLEQVTGFQMFGELLGLGGINTGRHEVHAVALEDSQVCVVPYAGLMPLLRELPTLQKQFHRVMSREIGGDHLAMLQLGSMHAEERLAAFLLNLMHRLQARGFSESSVLLRMSREEIGSYLGLKLETVSRTFSKFQASGLLSVQHREIHITDPIGLQQVLAPSRADAR